MHRRTKKKKKKIAIFEEWKNKNKMIFKRWFFLLKYFRRTEQSGDRMRVSKNVSFLSSQNRVIFSTFFPIVFYRLGVLLSTLLLLFLLVSLLLFLHATFLSASGTEEEKERKNWCAILEEEGVRILNIILYVAYQKSCKKFIPHYSYSTVFLRKLT